MKRLIDLYGNVAIDMATWCSASTADYERLCLANQRDIDTVVRRVEHEGISFLTISLPQFVKDFERALSQSCITDDLFRGFRSSGAAVLPNFLGGYTRLVFDSIDGRLLDDPRPEAIRAVRQLGGMFAKISLECSDARKEKALASYIECENDVERKTLELVRSEMLLSSFADLAGLVFGPVLARLDGNIENFELVPAHGPGATVDKLKGNQKWTLRQWHERLESVFPATDYLIPSPRFFNDLGNLNIVEPAEEAPVKVILVPKTLKTPRVIAIEPTCMQYAQQAVSRALVKHLEQDPLLSGDGLPSDPAKSRWTARTSCTMIGFTDQEPNQVLAHEGSLSGELATLDLSEASDRVPNVLVEALLVDHPISGEAIQACRSLQARVPGHGVIPLTKFASMGSALCFPIEAMVFLTTVLLGIQNALNRPLKRSDILSLRGQVRVYGDDIIVPVEYAAEVVATLELFGFKVNANKSFWTGRFRESCGKEYYAGHDVSLVKLRTVIPAQLTDTDEIISLESFRNQCYQAGMWRTAAWCDEKLGRVLSGRYPTISDTSRLLGRHSVMAEKQPVGTMCDDLQVPLERGYEVKAPLPSNEIDGSAALLKWFVKQGDLPFAFDHLLRSGRPTSVNIRKSMAPRS
jgi:hypothetical protein